VKTKHSSIRLDEETQAIIAKYQEQHGGDISASDAVKHLVQAADGKKFLTVISSTLAPHEELSFFAGQLEKTKLLWREVKSRLNAPRPLDPNDAAGLKQWRDERAKIQKFYSDCDSLWHKAYSLSEVLTATSIDDWVNMEDLAMVLANAEQDYAKAAEKETDPSKKKQLLAYQALYQNLLAFLLRLGIKPTPPEQAPNKK
jgi:hypothetical protein